MYLEMSTINENHSHSGHATIFVWLPSSRCLSSLTSVICHSARVAMFVWWGSELNWLETTTCSLLSADVLIIRRYSDRGRRCVRLVLPRGGDRREVAWGGDDSRGRVIQRMEARRIEWKSVCECVRMNIHVCVCVQRAVVFLWMCAERERSCVCLCACVSS